MAIPVFVAASAKAAAAQDATPALPAGMSAGAIVILVAVCPTANTISISAAGSIATWTAVSGSPITVASGEALYVWWGRWASGSTGPTLHASASDTICAATAAWSGCLDTGTPIDIATTGTETTSDTSFSFATGISSTRNNCLALCVASILRDSNTASVPVMTNASLGSLASRLNFCTNTGSGGGFGLSEGTKATAGTLGTWACTYAASSPKGYLTFALIGGTSGVVTATALTVTDTVVGIASKTGAATTSLTVSDIVAGTRTVLGAAALALTVTDTVAGSVSKTGAASLDLTVADTIQATRTTFDAAPLSLAVDDSVNGTRSTWSVVAPTDLTVVDTVAGSVTKTGTAALDLTVTDTVAGIRTTSGSAALELTLTDMVDGSVSKAGAAALDLLVTNTIQATRTTLGATSLDSTISDGVTGRVTKTGVATLEITVTNAAQGTRTTFGGTDVGLIVADVVAGTRSTWASVAPSDLAVSQTISGGVIRFGTTATTIVVSQTLAAIRETFGALAASEIVSQTIAGIRGTAGVVTATILTITDVVDGEVGSGGISAQLDLTVTQTVAGARMTFGLASTVMTVMQLIDGDTVQLTSKDIGSRRPEVLGLWAAQPALMRTTSRFPGLVDVVIGGRPGLADVES